jgi:integrase
MRASPLAAGDGRRYISAKTKDRGQGKLQQVQWDQTEGVHAESKNLTVGEAVSDWLEHGMVGKEASTISNRRTLAERHVIPALRPIKLVNLTTRDIDRFLPHKAQTLSTASVERLLSILRRSIRRAQAQDLIRRNVALLCEVPRGQTGRPSKALTLAEAQAILDACEGRDIQGYVVTGLLTGARTEELRALTRAHLDLDDHPPSIQVWRSVRRGGKTKTEKSRRTLELPDRCVDAPRQIKTRDQACQRPVIGDALVFHNSSGTALDAANVRRAFRTVVAAAGLDPRAWTPRELRHSFVSLLSSSGMPIEEISHLVGHASTRVTEKVYRKELRPVLTRGARAVEHPFDPKSES